MGFNSHLPTTQPGSYQPQNDSSHIAIYGLTVRYVRMDGPQDNRDFN